MVLNRQLRYERQCYCSSAVTWDVIMLVSRLSMSFREARILECAAPRNHNCPRGACGNNSKIDMQVASTLLKIAERGVGVAGLRLIIRAPSPRYSPVRGMGCEALSATSGFSKRRVSCSHAWCCSRLEVIIMICCGYIIQSLRGLTAAWSMLIKSQRGRQERSSGTETLKMMWFREATSHNSHR
jgi:hypothetical protein